MVYFRPFTKTRARGPPHLDYVHGYPPGGNLWCPPKETNHFKPKVAKNRGQNFLVTRKICGGVATPPAPSPRVQPPKRPGPFESCKVVSIANLGELWLLSNKLSAHFKGRNIQV